MRLPLLTLLSFFFVHSNAFPVPLELRIDLTHNQVTRTAFVSIPPRYRRIERTITYLHGMGDKTTYCNFLYQSIEKNINYDDSTILICPLGSFLSERAQVRSWNAGNCCGSTQNDSEFLSLLIKMISNLSERSYDDLYTTLTSSHSCIHDSASGALITSLTPSKEKKLCVRRTNESLLATCRKESLFWEMDGIFPTGTINRNWAHHVLGFSNGAMMAQRLLCEYPSYFYSISSIAGQLAYPGCAQSFILTEFANANQEEEVARFEQLSTGPSETDLMDVRGNPPREEERQVTRQDERDGEERDGDGRREEEGEEEEEEEGSSDYERRRWMRTFEWKRERPALLLSFAGQDKSVPSGGRAFFPYFRFLSKTETIRTWRVLLRVRGKGDDGSNNFAVLSLPNPKIERNLRLFKLQRTTWMREGILALQVNEWDDVGHQGILKEGDDVYSLEGVILSSVMRFILESEDD